MRVRVLRHGRLLTFAAVIAGFFLLVLLLRNTTPVVVAFHTLRAGLFSAGTSISRFTDDIFYSRLKLEEENTELKRQLTALAIDRVDYQELQGQVKELQALLNYMQTSDRNGLLAQVMGRSGEIEGDTLLVDQGSEEGSRVGAAVISGDGMFVGVVVAVEPHASVVRLLIDESSNVGAKLMNATETIGIAEGQGGVLLKVSFIPQSADVAIDQLLATSGLDPQIPPGLVIGVVREVLKDEHDPFQAVLVEPLIDLEHLSVVEIL